MYYCCSQIFHEFQSSSAKLCNICKACSTLLVRKRNCFCIITFLSSEIHLSVHQQNPPWEAACDKDSSAPCTASVGSAGYLGQAQMLGRMQLQWLFQSQLPAVQGQQPTWLVRPPPLEQAPQSESKRALVVHRAAFTRCRQSPDLHKASRVSPGLRSVDF